MVRKASKLPESALRYWREQRGLTAKELGRLVNTTQQQITKLENDQRRLTRDWIWRLASVLQVPPAYLLMDPAAADFRDLTMHELFHRLPSEEKDRIIKIASALSESNIPVVKRRAG